MRKNILYLVLVSLIISMSASIFFLSSKNQKLYRSLIKAQQVEIGLYTKDAIHIGLEKGLFDYIQSTLSSLTQYKFFEGAILFDEEKNPILRIPETFNRTSHKILHKELNKDFAAESYDQIKQLKEELLTYQLLPFLDEAGEPLGYLLLTFSLEEAEQELYNSLKVSILIGFFVATPMIFFIAWRVQRMLRPLDNAVGVLEAVAGGDFTQTLTYNKNDEIGRMACALNTATAGLREKTEALITAKNEADILREKAETANNAKNEFLSRMSHELRTPMNAILGFGQLLEMDNENLSDNQKEGIEHIMDGGNHLLMLINEVLDIAKIDANEVEIKLQPILLDELMKSIISLIQPMATMRNIKIQVPSVTHFWVKADQQRLKQVLLNLISNAIKYNHDSGEVNISVLSLPNEFARISIADNGYGIKKEDQAEIFEPFKRVSDRQENIEGTGIGLTITKKLVEIMGGRIGFESEYNKGSTFWIELPLSNNKEERLTGESESSFGSHDTP